MKNEFLKYLNCLLACFFLTPVNTLYAQTTYYFDGSGSVHSTSTWWTLPNFTGAHPNAFNGGNTYVIPKGTSATNTSTWNVNASGTRIILDSQVQFTMAADVSLASGVTLQLNNGAVWNAGTFTLSGAGALQLQNARIRMAKNDVTLPELTGSYSFDNSVVEICGNGAQTVRGNRSYSCLEFSGASGTKVFSAAITGSNTLDSLAITGANIVNLENRTIGNSITDVFMNAGSLVVTGSGQKPDAAGIYTLMGGEIVYSGSSATSQTIRNGISFFNLRIAGTNVATSSGNISIKSGGYFTIDSGAVWNMTNTNIGIVADNTVNININGVFRVFHAFGLMGSTTTAIRGQDAILTFGGIGCVAYCRAGSQEINDLQYLHLELSGSGSKTGNDLSIAGNLTIIGDAVYAGNSPAYLQSSSLVYQDDNPAGSITVGPEWPALDGPENVTLEFETGAKLILTEPRTIVGTLNLVSGILSLDSVELTLAGYVSGDGFIAANGTSSLKISGNGNMGTLHMDQGSYPVSCTWKQVEMQANNSGMLTLGNPFIVKDLINLKSGTLVSNSHLELSSDSAGNYAQLYQDGGTVSGNLQCETWITGNEGWRYLSAPLNTTLADLVDDVPVSFDPAWVNIYRWDAASSRWQIPAGTSAAWNGTSPVGVFFPDSVMPCRIRVSGSLWQMPVNNTLHYDNSGSPEDFFGNPDGWNMMGNPFPFTLDWQKVYGNIGGTVNTNYYIYNSGEGSYYSHNGSTGHASLNGGIAPFQAFFIKLGQSSDEADHGLHFDSSQYKSGRVNLYKNGVAGVQFRVIAPDSSRAMAGVWANSNALAEFDPRHDAFFLGADTKKSPMFFIRSDNKALSAKYLPEWKIGHLVNLELNPSLTGKYSIMADIAGIPDGFELWLVNEEIKQEHNLSASQYIFTTQKNSRMVFRIEMREKTVNNVAAIPTKNERMILGPEGIIIPESWPSSGTIQLTDLMGRCVYEGSPDNFNALYPNGCYIISYRCKSFVSSHFINLTNP